MVNKFLTLDGLTYYDSKLKSVLASKDKATSTTDGLMSKEDKAKLDTLKNYTLPAATSTTLGGVKVGSGISVKTDGTISVAPLTSLDASKITSGTIDIARLPKSALERLIVVTDDTARFALTTTTAQIGDTVKVTNTGKMYLIKDDTKLSTADGYEEYTAGSASSVPWSGVTGKPATFAPSTHNQASNTITAMTGYAKASAVAAIATTDSLNVAIGKLEKSLDNKLNASDVVAIANTEIDKLFA